MKPYEGEWRYSFIAEDIDRASAIWEKFDIFADSLGLNGEGGGVSQLKANELIPGSLTHGAIQKAEGK